MIGDPDNKMNFPNLDICIPFDGAETQVAMWANNENEINFRFQHDLAMRCTLAFAALELKEYLGKTIDADITIKSAENLSGQGEFNIHLHVENPASKNESFIIDPVSRGIHITGKGRTGALYGVYEFLRLQGWRWFAPGPEGEIIPQKRDRLVLPEKPVSCSPSFPNGRGFVFEYQYQDSRELWLWMARNRLNMSGCRPATAAFCEKLGMSSAIGGHIFDKFLNPEKVMSSGKTLWEEHPEWFGQPDNGTRRKETAYKTQFCVSQGGLIKFLGDELLKFLNREWYYADRIDIWGFDTWGAICNCPDCVKLGNGTDHAVYFASALRDFLNNARENGKLDHEIQLAICAYEGTATVKAPTRPIQENLIAAGDCVTFFPINRCYAHDFADQDCSWNRKYADNLNDWFACTPKFPVMICEYYNVSKFEDLPLLFIKRMTADMRQYYDSGVSGISYMHLPFANWGIRTITQLLHAQLAWDIDTDIQTFLTEYFRSWYGRYSDKMRKVYQLAEEAWSHCSQWRAWSKHSLLSQLAEWAESKDSFISGNDHFTPMEAVTSGRHSIRLLKQALAIVDIVLKQEQNRVAFKHKQDGSASCPVNPTEVKLVEQKRGFYEKHLEEDRRLLLYGLDTMCLMTALLDYGIAIENQNISIANLIYKEIENVSESLNNCLMPLTFTQFGPGFTVRDALTRTQLRDCIRKCRKLNVTVCEKKALWIKP